MAATIQCVILSEATKRKIRSVAKYILNANERLRSLLKSLISVVEHFGQRNIYLFFHFKLISAKNRYIPAWPDGNANMKDLCSCFNNYTSVTIIPGQKSVYVIKCCRLSLIGHIKFRSNSLVSSWDIKSLMKVFFMEYLLSCSLNAYISLTTSPR